MTAFFIPGITTDERVLEHAYDDMRQQIALDMGRAPRARRILRLWARRGNLDCVTEVGVRDPVRGGTVMAIFDLGAHQPFIVWRQPDGIGQAVREVVGGAYFVLEFDS